MLPYTDQQLLSLSPAGLRTLLAIRVKIGSKTAIDATMEELGTLTGYSRETLRKAIVELSGAGFLEVTRTKRNLGKLSVNRYSLPCQVQLASGEPPCQVELASTADSNSDTTINHTYLTSNRKLKYKEIRVSKRWNPNEDDHIVGVGLFGDEKPASQKPLSTDKRDPKTRGRRPQEEWTPADVAAEFRAQLTKKYPYMPPLVNTKELAGALARSRKSSGVTPLIELEVLRIFMADPKNHADWEKAQMHGYLYKRFLKLLQTHTPVAMKNLGMDVTRPLTERRVVDDRVEKLYASDGTEFDSTLPGKKALERYEQKLRENAG
jgi:hypothetical protein